MRTIRVIPCQVCEATLPITIDTPLDYVCPPCVKALGDMPKGVQIGDAVESIRFQMIYGFGRRSPRAVHAGRN